MWWSCEPPGGVVVGRCLDARSGPGARGSWRSRALMPVLARSRRRPASPTVLPCPGPVAPPSLARCWLPCSWWSRSASWPPRRTVRRGSPSRSAPSSSRLRPRSPSWCLVDRLTRSVRCVRRCLLGLLSLAVAAVVAKEIWLQWLATTEDPGSLGVAGRRHCRERVVDPRDVRPAPAPLPGRHGAVASVAVGRRPRSWSQRSSPRPTARWRRSRSAHRSPGSRARSARLQAGGRPSRPSRSSPCSCWSSRARSPWCCGSAAPMALRANRSSGSPWPGSGCRSTRSSA